MGAADEGPVGKGARGLVRSCAVVSFSNPLLPPPERSFQNPSKLTLPFSPRPIVRQKLIHDPHIVNFEEFFIPFTSRLSLNWPYPADQVLVTNPNRSPNSSHRRSSGGSSGGEDDSVMMNPVFETHLRDLGNWSMGRLFATTFPFLIDESVRIKD